MKRVVLTIPTLTGGGAERVVSVWAAQLAERGFDVHILLSGRVPGMEYALSEHVHIHSIAPSYETYQQLSLWQKIYKRRIIIKTIQPDYVIPLLPHIQIQTRLATWGLPIRRIETIRVSPWRAEPHNRLWRFLWKECYRSAYKVILQTKEQGEYYSDAIRAKSVIIPNPLNDIYQSSYKQQYAERPTRFIAVGRIVPQKNYPMMIRAFAVLARIHPEIILDIFGEEEDASYLASVQRLIEDEGMAKQIFLRGRSMQIHEEYKAHDVFLLTSNFEGMPNALVEAMASGLPCISTDCKTGPKDLITEGISGFLSPVEDEKRWMDAMQRVLLLTRSEQEKIGQEARKSILDKCSIVHSVNVLMHILQ